MFAVFRIEKFKKGDAFAVLREAQRTPELHSKKGVEFDNNIDWTKTSNNVSIVSSRVADISRKMKNEGVKPRNKDSVVLVGAIVTASPEYFNRDKDGNWLYDEKTQAYGQDVKKLIIEQLCGGEESRLVSLQLHMDEDSPHWHALVVPIVENEQGEKKLSAKALLNGRQRMRQLQDRAFEILGKPRGFERGQLVDLSKPSKSQKRHKTTGQYRDERAQAALDKIIGALDYMEQSDAYLLQGLKDAPFGRGKILPYDKYERANALLARIDGVCEAKRALEDLRDQANKSGRIKTLEGTISNAHKVVDRIKPELLFRRQYSALVDKIFESMPVDHDRTALDVLRSCVERSTVGGEIDIEKALSKFKQDIKATKANERAFQQDLDSFEFPSMEDPDGLDDPIFCGI